jgi:hypothetical protein
MALIVEDGSIVTGAESYCTVEYASAYHTARGNAAWDVFVELMTLDVAPAGAGWAAGDTITGATSAKTCVIAEKVTALTYYVKNRTGAFTLGEELSNGTISAEQGAAHPTFAETDALKEAALRKATDFMRQIYRSKWQGVKVDEDQALDWPRYDVVVEGYAIDSDIVPTEVKNACAELALRASAGDLLADQTQGVIREKVGQIEVEYDRSSPQQARYSAIDAMLAPYLLAGGSGTSMRIIRT